MGLVRKVRVAAAPDPAEKKKKKKADKPVVQVTLPDEPEDPITKISQATFLVYGENKIGKTSLLSQFEDPFFLMFEPGGKGLRIKRRQVESWAQFVAYVDAILASDKYETIGIDPVAKAYRMCVDHICEIEGVSDPRDVGWGNGWKAVEDEFAKQIERICSSERGVVMVGHPEQVEFTKHSGGEYHRICPRMMKQARNFIEGFVDVIAFYGYYGDKRYLTIEGSDELDAGNRLKYQFRTVEGDKIHSIPMGRSEVQAYRNLLKAFNNEQEKVGKPSDSARIGVVKKATTRRR